MNGSIVRDAKCAFIEAFMQKNDGMDQQQAKKLAKQEWVTSLERALLIDEIGPTEAKRRRLI